MSSYEHLDALVGRSVRFTVGPVAGRVGVVNGHTSDRQQLLVGLVPTLQTAGEPPRTITLAYHKLAASADDAARADALAVIVPPARAPPAGAPARSEGDAADAIWRVVATKSAARRWHAAARRSAAAAREPPHAPQLQKQLSAEGKKLLSGALKPVGGGGRRPRSKYKEMMSGAMAAAAPRRGEAAEPPAGRRGLGGGAFSKLDRI